LVGKLVPFVGAGASRIAGCPNWSEFADGVLAQFVQQGKFTYAELAQIKHLNPRMKLSIALGLQKQHKITIDFKKVLYPAGVKDSVQGRRLYESLSKLGTTFVTTNYDDWLHKKKTGRPAPTALPTTGAAETAPIEENRKVIHKVSEFTPDILTQPDTAIHLHGSVEDPDGMILTTPHYVSHYANDRGAKGAGKENNVLTLLDFLFTNYNVLFVGYGLEELEILEYVITKGRMSNADGNTEIRHYLLQGFYSHEEALARSLMPYYADCGVQMIPFLRDHQDWNQLVEVLESFAQLSPAQYPMAVKMMMDMGALLNS